MGNLLDISKLRDRIKTNYLTGNYSKAAYHAKRLYNYYVNSRDNDRVSVGNSINMCMDYADDLYNFGLIFQALLDYKNAIKYYSESAKIVESLRGANEEFAKRLNNLAICRIKKGELPAGLVLFKTSADIYKEKGEYSRDYHQALYNLSNVHLSLGEIHEAIENFLLLLNLVRDEGVFFSDILNCLGYCYEERREYSHADIYFLRALKIKKNIIGELSEEFLADILSYARFCDSSGQKNKALVAYAKSVQIIKKMLSERHPYYISSLSRMAELYYLTGELEKSLKFWLRTKKIMEVAGLVNQLYYSNCLRSLGIIYREFSENEKAIKYLLSSLEIKARIMGKNSVEYLRDALLLCGCYAGNKEYQKAMECLSAVLKSTEVGKLDELREELSKIVSLMKQVNL